MIQLHEAPSDDNALHFKADPQALADSWSAYDSAEAMPSDQEALAIARAKPLKV